MTNQETILSQIKQAVWEVDPKAEVILFGSQARGDVHVESDWDILILNNDNKATWAYKQAMIKKILHVELQLGISIGTVIRNKADWQVAAQTWFYQEVEKEGRLLV